MANDRGSRGQLAAWLAVAALVVVQLAPLALRRGIFLDGLVYATISRNMAVGIGDALHPVYTGAIQPFYDHPPLAFWLESLAFRLLGDHWWVEKAYSIFVTLLSGGAIWMLWRWLTRATPAARRMGWLPVGMWALLPCWQWTAANNLLENTLTVFALAGVYASLRAAEIGRAWLPWTAASAGMIVAAALVKGPVGLFPLVAPLVAVVAFKRSALSGAARQAALVALTFGALGLVLLDGDCYEYFHAYVEQQVLRSLKGQRETHPSIIGRAHILWEIVSTLSASMIFVWGCRALARRREAEVAPDASLRQAALAMLAVGIAASAPVAISPKQTNFYITPSYPYYVLGLSLLSAESLVALGRQASCAAWTKINRRVGFVSVAAMLAGVGLSCVGLGEPRRDLEAIAIAQAIRGATSEHVTIDTPAGISRQWALIGYLYRNDCITLTRDNARRKFRLEDKSSGRIPAGYEEVAVEMPRYRLLRRVDVLEAERSTTRFR